MVDAVEAQLSLRVVLVRGPVFLALVDLLELQEKYMPTITQTCLAVHNALCLKGLLRGPDHPINLLFWFPLPFFRMDEPNIARVPKPAFLIEASSSQSGLDYSLQERFVS